MSQRIINIGNADNDGTGTPLRTAMTYVNQNFTELYDDFAQAANTSSPVISNTLTVNTYFTVNSSYTHASNAYVNTLKVDQLHVNTWILLSNNTVDNVSLQGTNFQNYGYFPIFIIQGNANGSTVGVGVQNANSGKNSSSDILCFADNGGPGGNYIDMGINSSGYNNTQMTIMSPLSGYLLTTNTNLSIGTGANNAVIRFHANGTLAADLKMTISAANVVLANTVPLYGNNAYLYGQINAASFKVGSLTVANTTGVFTPIVNASSVTIGSATTVNSSGLFSTGKIDVASVNVGSAFTANSTLVNAAAITVTGGSNSATIYATTSANIAGAVYANGSGLYSTGIVNASAVNTATLTVDGTFISNSSGTFTNNVPIQSGNGVYSVGAFNGTFSDGIVLDYVTGNGRLSVGTDDSFTIYTGNVGTTAMFVANSTQVTISNALSVSGNLTVTGNLILAGSTTWINSTVITTNDKNFIFANNAATNTAANNAGIVVGTSANLIYNSTLASWQSNVNITPATNNLRLGNTGNVWDIYANNITAVSITGNGATMTSVNAAALNGTAAANFVQNTDSRTLSGNLVLSGANTTFTGTSVAVNGILGVNTVLSASGSNGTAGYFLTSNGNSNVYWSAISGAYVQNTDSRTLSGNLVLSGANTTFSGASVTASSNVTFTGALVNSTANVVVSSASVYLSGASANVTIASNNFNFGSSTKAANGYSVLPNGMKMNWGWVASNSTVGSITFTSSFTTNAYIVTATSNTAASTYQAAVTAWTNLGATILTANAATANVYWMAIGV